MVTQLLKDLAEAKMWPIKLAGVKCQETLRDTLTVQASALEQGYFELKAMWDAYNKA
ncbi:unnamed protein product [Durusdinium trenchii]|uniref:Uncharacterized protein n=2 Tax=Durusdinium trenchii TaxID=1381693 RepID=A0ABP0LW57_9DINO